ncbi:hypothetical protein JXO52_02785 [bacterium]|nr:hypothetical protein [bacterium]
MSRRTSSLQGDLFISPDEQNPALRVKELDKLIAAALKKGKYDLARELTAEQEHLIQHLVSGSDE